jgi:hypothetical protein
MYLAFAYVCMSHVTISRDFVLARMRNLYSHCLLFHISPGLSILVGSIPIPYACLPTKIPSNSSFLEFGAINDRIQYRNRIQKSLVFLPVPYHLNTDWEIFVELGACI